MILARHEYETAVRTEFEWDLQERRQKRSNYESEVQRLRAETNATLTKLKDQLVEAKDNTEKVTAFCDAERDHLLEEATLFLNAEYEERKTVMERNHRGRMFALDRHFQKKSEFYSQKRAELDVDAVDAMEGRQRDFDQEIAELQRERVRIELRAKSITSELNAAEAQGCPDCTEMKMEIRVLMEKKAELQMKVGVMEKEKADHEVKMNGIFLRQKTNNGATPQGFFSSGILSTPPRPGTVMSKTPRSRTSAGSF
jgi:phage host-nuclease inhibitor protein Gam